MGIGKGIKEDTLQLIVGDANPVIQVKNFDQLDGMIEKIKSAACSGEFSWL